MGKAFKLRNGLLLVSTEAPGGVYNSAQLKKIAALCDGEAALAKATEDQRLALFVAPEKAARVAQELKSLGLGVRHYQDGLHQPINCLGELCPEHLQDAMGASMDIAKELAGITLGQPLKIGINGCARCCLATHTLDISIVGDSNGYRISLGGKNSQIPEMASFMAEGVPSAKLPKLIAKVIMAYKELAHKDESLQEVMERAGSKKFIDALAPYSQDAASSDPFAGMGGDGEAQDDVKIDTLPSPEELGDAGPEIDAGELALEGGADLELATDDDAVELMADGDGELMADADVGELIADGDGGELMADADGSELLADGSELMADADGGELIADADGSELLADGGELMADADGNELLADGSELMADADAVELIADADGVELMPDGVELMADGSELMADDSNLLANGDALIPDGDDVLALADATDADRDAGVDDLVLAEPGDLELDGDDLDLGSPATVAPLDDDLSEESFVERPASPAVAKAAKIQAASAVPPVKPILASVPPPTDDELNADEVNDEDADAFEQQLNVSIEEEESLPPVEDLNSEDRLAAMRLVENGGDEAEGAGEDPVWHGDTHVASVEAVHETLEVDGSFDHLGIEHAETFAPEMIAEEDPPARRAPASAKTSAFFDFSGLDLTPDGKVQLLFASGARIAVDPRSITGTAKRELKIAGKTVVLAPDAGGLSVEVDGVAIYLPRQAA